MVLSINRASSRPRLSLLVSSPLLFTCNTFSALGWASGVVKWLVSLFYRDCFFFTLNITGPLYLTIFMGVKRGKIRVAGSDFLTRVNLPCLGCFLLILFI